MGDFTKVAELRELSEGNAVIVQIEGKEIALFRLGEEVFALENFCPHRGGPLGEGIVRGDQVTCPWHDWSFEIRTGLCTFNPAARARSYPARVSEGSVEVRIE